MKYTHTYMCVQAYTHTQVGTDSVLFLLRHDADIFGFAQLFLGCCRRHLLRTSFIYLVYLCEKCVMRNLQIPLST